MRKPVTRDGAGDPDEFELTGPQSAPTAITDPNVYEIPSVMRAVNNGDPDVPEVEELWQFKARFTGATAASTDCQVTLWLYDYWLDEFYASAKIRLVGVNGLSTALGNVVQIPGVLGTSHIGLEIDSGLAAGDTIHWLHEWS
jgi:hypothetical protein